MTLFTLIDESSYAGYPIATYTDMSISTYFPRNADSNHPTFKALGSTVSKFHSGTCHKDQNILSGHTNRPERLG